MNQNSQQASHEVCKECGTPAGAGTYCKWAACPGGDRPAPASFAGPIMHLGEVYAGICQDPDLGAIHLILLPGDVHADSIQEANEFAASVGGELPTLAELEHLHKHMSNAFEPALYYACDEEDYDGDGLTMIPVMFDFAGRTDLLSVDWGSQQVRVRAVRRVMVDAGQTAPESAESRMDAGSQPLAAVGADDILVISSTALMTLARQLMAEELDDCNEDFLAGRAHGIGSLHSEILVLASQSKVAHAGELAREALSAVSWLYRRLPHGFGRQNHIEVVIERLARETGTNMSDLIERRPVKQTEKLTDVEQLS